VPFIVFDVEEGEKCMRYVIIIFFSLVIGALFAICIWPKGQVLPSDTIPNGLRKELDKYMVDNIRRAIV